MFFEYSRCEFNKCYFLSLLLSLLFIFNFQLGENFGIVERNSETFRMTRTTSFGSDGIFTEDSSSDSGFQSPIVSTKTATISTSTTTSSDFISSTINATNLRTTGNNASIHRTSNYFYGNNLRNNNNNNNNNNSNNSNDSNSPLLRNSMTISPSSIRRRKGKTMTLVLDLDETLIHSTSRGTRNHDHIIEVLVERHVCLYYVYKRPHVDYFLKKVS